MEGTRHDHHATTRFDVPFARPVKLIGLQIISCGAARIALAVAARKTVPAPAA